MKKMPEFANGIPKKTLHRILTEMAQAVRHIHCEHYMVHKDLHCANFMITKDLKVKLIDFGLAAIYGKNGISKDFWCPPLFQPPELLRGEPTGFEGDIYFLAFGFY